MRRRTYLRRCIGISLRHRASWVVMGGLAGLLVAALLNLGALGLILLTLLAAGLSASAIALNSYLRHSDDAEARPREPFMNQDGGQHLDSQH